MKLKIDFRILFFVLCITLFAACSSDDDPVEEPTLSLEPNKSGITFTAEAEEVFDFEIITNQASWEAISNKTWCKVEMNKTNKTFKVTATPNTSTTPPEDATITVSAGNAQPKKITVSQYGVGATLSISPEATDGILFSADPDNEAFTFEVTTNQTSWDAVSSQSWCKISKTANSFTVTAIKNLLTEPQTAQITISAGNAGKITIDATQKAVTGSGGQEDNGTTIWEDTHWRLFQLRGNPKSVKWDNNLVEFSPLGKVTKAIIDITTEEYEYDSKQRIIKYTTNEYGDNRTYQFKYGNHTKYTSTFVKINNIDYLIRGVSEVTRIKESETKTYPFSINSSSIITKNGDYQVEWTYSGDYPTKCKDGYPDEIWTTEYKYGKNYKYAEIIEIDELETSSGQWSKKTYNTKFVVDNTIYLLVKETDRYGSKMYEYDEKGRDAGYNYKEDTKGNWIEATPISFENGQKAITREILYY